MTDAEGRPVRDLHVLTLALETLEGELEATTDPSEHRELTEQIRALTARIDRLIGILPKPWTARSQPADVPSVTCGSSGDDAPPA